jgi:hypothetical protein
MADVVVFCSCILGKAVISLGEKVESVARVEDVHPILALAFPARLATRSVAGRSVLSVHGSCCNFRWAPARRTRPP